MTYDCFPFFNELDLLEIRLNVLNDVVDKFVLVEAGETHTGKPKPMHYAENKERFAAFESKIIHIVIDRFPAGHAAWWNENYQRNEIIRGLADAKPNDDILISDMDEIPNPEAIQKYAGTEGVKVFHQKYYSFYLNYLNVRCQNLMTTKMLPYHLLRNGFDGIEVLHNEFLAEDINVGTTVTKVRRRTMPKSRGGERVIRDGGWHFTCLGGAKAMVEKMRAVAPHHDFDPDDASLTPERMTALISRGQGPALKMNCFAVPIDDTFPAFIRDHQAEYAHLIFPITPEYMNAVRIPRALRTMQGRLIQCAEWLCPAALHNQLHLLKMRMIGK